MSKALVDALHLKKTEFTPVWYMRQAGRCIPEYRRIREKYSLTEISTNPELLAKVTLQPVNTLGVDGAILFADIMTPLAFMGIDFDIIDSKGPVIKKPIRENKDIENIHNFNPETDFSYLKKGIGIIKDELPEEKTLIGFCGAPFTLASYIIEGEGTKDFIKTKTLMYENKKMWNKLLDKLSHAMIIYLKEQIKYGIDAFQLFDSWAGYLSSQDYVEYVLPFTQKIFDTFKDTNIASIHFSTNTGSFLKEFSSVSSNAISIDWRMPINKAWGIIGQKAIQGNLDPSILFCNIETIKKKVDYIFEGVKGRSGFIFNLGHGILPDTPLQNLISLTEYVHGKQ